jgi:hypothetical protein
LRCRANTKAKQCLSSRRLRDGVGVAEYLDPMRPADWGRVPAIKGGSFGIRDPLSDAMGEIYSAEVAVLAVPGGVEQRQPGPSSS